MKKNIITKEGEFSEATIGNTPLFVVQEVQYSKKNKQKSKFSKAKVRYTNANLGGTNLSIIENFKDAIPPKNKLNEIQKKFIKDLNKKTDELKEQFIELDSFVVQLENTTNEDIVVNLFDGNKIGYTQENSQYVNNTSYVLADNGINRKSFCSNSDSTEFAYPYYINNNSFGTWGIYIQTVDINGNVLRNTFLYETFDNFSFQQLKICYYPINNSYIVVAYDYNLDESIFFEVDAVTLNKTKESVVFRANVTNKIIYNEYSQEIMFQADYRSVSLNAITSFDPQTFVDGGTINISKQTNPYSNIIDIRNIVVNTVNGNIYLKSYRLDIFYNLPNNFTSIDFNIVSFPTLIENSFYECGFNYVKEKNQFVFVLSNSSLNETRIKITDTDLNTISISDNLTKITEHTNMFVIYNPTNNNYYIEIGSSNITYIVDNSSVIYRYDNNILQGIDLYSNIYIDKRSGNNTIYFTTNNGYFCKTNYYLGSAIMNNDEYSFITNSMNSSVFKIMALELNTNSVVQLNQSISMQYKDANGDYNYETLVPNNGKDVMFVQPNYSCLIFKYPIFLDGKLMFNFKLKAYNSMQMIFYYKNYKLSDFLL